MTLSEPLNAAMPETSLASRNVSQYLSLWLKLVEFSVSITERVQTYASRTGQWITSLAGKFVRRGRSPQGNPGAWDVSE